MHPEDLDGLVASMTLGAVFWGGWQGCSPLPTAPWHCPLQGGEVQQKLEVTAVAAREENISVTEDTEKQCPGQISAGMITVAAIERSWPVHSGPLNERLHRS